MASFVEQAGLLIFTSGPEYSEVWSDNGGHDLYHASLSTEEYKQILMDNNFKVLVHKIRDPECGEATVWVAQKASGIREVNSLNSYGLTAMPARGLVVSAENSI